MTHESTLNVTAHLAGRNALTDAGYSPNQIRRFFEMRAVFERAALKHSLESKENRRGD